MCYCYVLRVTNLTNTSVCFRNDCTFVVIAGSKWTGQPVQTSNNRDLGTESFITLIRTTADIKTQPRVGDNASSLGCSRLSSHHATLRVRTVCLVGGVYKQVPATRQTALAALAALIC